MQVETSKTNSRQRVPIYVCVAIIVTLTLLAWSLNSMRAATAESNTELQRQNYDLQQQLDDLTFEHEQYVDTHGHYDYEYDSLCFDHESYVCSHTHTNSEYETSSFRFYYVKPEQKFGVYDLDAYLNFHWTKPYQEGVFDCSEMSAALERKLENEGWHTKIKVGPSPFSSGRHAWLLVETSSGAYMPVEATTISIVWWENPNFHDYFTYADHSFETIQDALEYSSTEFDWWNS